MLSISGCSLFRSTRGSASASQWAWMLVGGQTIARAPPAAAAGVPRHPTHAHPRRVCAIALLQLQTKFDEERDSSCEVVDNNADVVHPSNRHVSLPPA
jgi:hypothetical protein